MVVTHEVIVDGLLEGQFGGEVDRIGTHHVASLIVGEQITHDRLGECRFGGLGEEPSDRSEPQSSDERPRQHLEHAQHDEAPTESLAGV